MKKIILPVLVAGFVVGCTPHGRYTPFSKDTWFNFGAPIELKEAERQASLAKSPQQALAYYESVYNNNRNNADVATAYAGALRKAGFSARGIVVLEDHYMDRDVSQETVLEYIKCHIAAGQFDDAETLLKKRIAYDAQDQQEQLEKDYLAAVREARIQKVIEPERPDFSQLQGNPAYHNLLGVVYDARGKSAEAEGEFRNALGRWDGENGVVENNLALALVNQGKVKEAMDVISKAFATAPHRPEVARNLEIITALYKKQ